MAGRPLSVPSGGSNLNLNLDIQPPLPASNAGSHRSAPFTPRSSTFPDGLGSDSEFDAFEPTPVHSPAGPHYDDLPPTYDEAQAQALEEARTGVPPLDPNNLEIYRMVLGDHPSPPPRADTRPHQPRRSLLDDPNAYEFEPENQRNASGLGQTIPVQQTGSSEQIPVGRVPSTNSPAVGAVASIPGYAAILERALDFTRHGPDADARYAPRLSRLVAIPQEGVPLSRGARRGPGRHRSREGGEGGSCSSRVPVSQNMRIPGQWPESGSSEVVTGEADSADEPVQFMRAYAKALHAHSIRPAEFMEFLDGLNTLCDATDTLSIDLVASDTPKDAPSVVVQQYIDRANTSFFAPRGLKIQIKSLSWLVEALKIPEERGQRAAAVATALEESSTTTQRAQAIHPWVEGLETNNPEPSSHTLVLREMARRARRRNSKAKGSQQEPKQADLGDDDPPHSIPDLPPHPPQPGFPLFPSGPWGTSVPGGGPWATHRGPAARADYQSYQGQQSSWDRRGSHHGRNSGMGHGPWGHRGRRGAPAFPFGPRGCEPFTPGNNNNNNNWATFGQNMGKWGEEFGKRMEEWGEQFGKRAGEWGNEVGRQAQSWAGAGDGGHGGTGAHVNQHPRGTATTAPNPETLAPQETGVQRKDIPINITQSNPKDKEKGKVASKHNDDCSFSSSSSDSSDSSDSDSEDDDEGEELSPSPHDIFLTRLRAINAAATASASKGKKSPQEIATERSLAIEKAQAEKTFLELKIEQRREKRALKKQLRARKREIKKEHKKVKRELKGLKDRGGKEIRKKAKEEFRERKREIRQVKKERRRERREKRRGRRSLETEREVANGMTWVVISNLGEE